MYPGPFYLDRISGGKMDAGMDEAFLTFVVDDINWENKYIGSETIRTRFPKVGKTDGNL